MPSPPVAGMVVLELSERRPGPPSPRPWLSCCPSCCGPRASNFFNCASLEQSTGAILCIVNQFLAFAIYLVSLIPKIADDFLIGCELGRTEKGLDRVFSLISSCRRRSNVSSTFGLVSAQMASICWR